MTLIANLVFIEEAVYIYRKIPSSKRSIIIWINAAAPVSYHGKEIKLNVENRDSPESPHKTALSLPFIQLSSLSLQVIATTSCIGMWVPRSTMFTDFTSAMSVFCLFLDFAPNPEFLPFKHLLFVVNTVIL